MEKEKEKNTEEEGIETKEETNQEVKTVSLVEVPTQFGLAYSTPEGNMRQDQYLVWLGNMFLDFKAAIAGN